MDRRSGKELLKSWLSYKLGTGQGRGDQGVETPGLFPSPLWWIKGHLRHLKVGEFAPGAGDIWCQRSIIMVLQGRGGVMSRAGAERECGDTCNFAREAVQLWNGRRVQSHWLSTKVTVKRPELAKSLGRKVYLVSSISANFLLVLEKVWLNWNEILWGTRQTSSNCIFPAQRPSPDLG